MIRVHYGSVYRVFHKDNPPTLINIIDIKVGKMAYFYETLYYGSV